MKLNNLLQGVQCLNKINYANVNITGISNVDSDCDKGYLYFAISGNNFDGVMFASHAVERGAKAVVTESAIEGLNCIQIVVPDVRIAMSAISRNYYGKSDTKLDIIAVVGTNGKTTTAGIMYNILCSCGKRVGLIGTLGVRINDIALPSDLTTPDPIELHYILSQMVGFGVEVVVMEVSAHAIALHKMYGIHCKLGIFTNISPEHLDFFGSMEKYVRTKVDYFCLDNMEMAVVNVDDEYGKKIVQSAKLPLLSYGLCNPADTFAIDVRMTINNMSFIVNALDEVFKVTSRFIGEYNVYNLLAVITACRALGVSAKQIQLSLKDMPAIEGRMEVFNFSKSNKVVVDFAHTPDGMDKVLKLIKCVRPNGKIITLFGCVGYSDVAKRALMGKVASKYSDYVILTADNPDWVNFDDICDDITLSVPNVRIADRKSAIEAGVAMLSKGDTLVCLGKGGEHKQRINGVNMPYNELEIVKTLTKRKAR